MVLMRKVHCISETDDMLVGGVGFKGREGMLTGGVLRIT